MLKSWINGNLKGGRTVRGKQWKEYAPVMTGLLLIALGLWLPLGSAGAPRLIDLFSYWALNIMGTII
jgi:hypothetical protein